MPETEKVHLKADRKNARSNKNGVNEKTAAEKSGTEARENELHTKTVDLTNELYSCQTGTLLITPSKGKNT